MKRNTYILGALALASGLAASSHAFTIATTEATGSNAYGNISGALIEFDSTPGATGLGDGSGGAATALVNGTEYNVNSISFEITAAASAPEVWLGAYSTLTTAGGAAPDGVSGLLAVSTNSVDFAALGGGTATFNFDALTVTAGNDVGTGSDIIYFVYQTSATAVTSLFPTRDGAAVTAAGGTNANLFQTDRIDGNQDAELYRALVLDGGQDYRGSSGSDALGSYRVGAIDSGGDDRIPLYSADLTVVPEPSSAFLATLGGVFLIGARRRK